MMTTNPLGGGIPRRDCHVIWLLDNSGSMRGAKIQSLNYAVFSVTDAMIAAAARHPTSNFFVRALSFADDVSWVVANPVPISEFQWKDIYQSAGKAALGRALNAVTEALDDFDQARRYFPPILILVSDGQPTDYFQGALARLLAHKIGRTAVRIAISLDETEQPECLRQFVSDGRAA